MSADDDDRPIVFARATAPDESDPGLVHLRPVSYTKRELTRNHVINVLKEQLARAEAGEIDEIVGVALKDGISSVFYAHSNVIRVLGSLCLARAVFEKHYIEGTFPDCPDDDTGAS